MRTVALLFLVLTLAVQAAETFRLPHEFEVDGVRLRVVGAEVTPDRRNFLAHVEVEELTGKENRVYWQDWFAAVAQDGTRMRPPTDVGVEDGSGLKRCFGSQPIGPHKRFRLLIYWPIYEHERPLRLQIAGGALSEEGYR